MRSAIRLTLLVTVNGYLQQNQLKNTTYVIELADTLTKSTSINYSCHVDGQGRNQNSQHSLLESSGYRLYLKCRVGFTVKFRLTVTIKVRIKTAYQHLSVV